MAKGFGIIGCGLMGSWHMRNMTEMGVKIAGISDTKEELLSRVKTEFNVDYATTRYEDLLKRDDIDGVIICTPNFLHCEMTIKAAEAGKDILVEKPMAPTLKECDEMIKACKQNAVTLLVGYCYRWEPQRAKAKELVQNGEIGEIIMMRSRIGGRALTWNPSTLYRFSKKESGGGALADWSHDIDLHLWIAGNIKEIFAFTDTLRIKSETEDIASLLVRYENGGIGTISCDYLLNPDPAPMEIYGDKGNLSVPQAHGKNTEVRLIQTGQTKKETLYSPPYEDPWKIEIQHFAQCMSREAEPLITGEDGKKVVEVILAAYKSNEEKRAISLR